MNLSTSAYRSNSWYTFEGRLLIVSAAMWSDFSTQDRGHNENDPLPHRKPVGLCYRLVRYWFDVSNFYATVVHMCIKPYLSACAVHYETLKAFMLERFTAGDWTVWWHRLPVWAGLDACADRCEMTSLCDCRWRHSWLLALGASRRHRHLYDITTPRCLTHKCSEVSNFVFRINQCCQQ